MRREQDMQLTHKFVEFIPEDLREGTIYVSVSYATVAHKCCCGCGAEVVTPLSPTDWKLLFDGETVSLDPSIGNWSFACQSHYWIKHNRIKWAGRWSQEEIDRGRARDRSTKESYFETAAITVEDVPADKPEISISAKAERGFWQKLKKRWAQWRGRT